MSLLTDVFVAACGSPEKLPKFGGMRRYCDENAQSVIADVLSERTKGYLIVIFLDERVKSKGLCKTLFSHFAENIRASPDSHTQITVSFVDEDVGDLVQYRCERLTDIDAVVEEENGTHACSTILASTVVPTQSTFNFADRRLTCVICPSKDFGGDELVNAVEGAATAVGCRFSSICVLLPGSSLCSADKATLEAPITTLYEHCRKRSIGSDERVGSRVRMQDVRAWSLMVSEQQHFSPNLSGPYFVSLNPKLVVGEKLAHAICEDTTYIVGEATNASPVDFVVLPPGAAGDITHRSVYSPHCRIRRDGLDVFLRPECGVSFVNGKLLAEEQKLSHNDRIIVGKQLAFRYVLVQTAVEDATDNSRILDWELCSKEFAEECKRTIQEGTELQGATEQAELVARCAVLEDRLANVNGDSWVILNNPPATYKGPLMWPFDTSAATLDITIGPSDCSVTLPFLSNTAHIRRQQDQLHYVCEKVSIRLADCSRFVIGNYSFSLSLCAQTAPGVVHAVGLKNLSGELVDEVKRTYFDLQWSLALLLDFAFPPPSRRDAKVPDNLLAIRKALCDDTVQTTECLSLHALTTVNRMLTNTIRMIGSGLSKEINTMYTGGSVAERSGEAPTLEAVLATAKKNSEVSAALLQAVYEEAGNLLLLQSREGGDLSTSLPRGSSMQSAHSDDMSATLQEKLTKLKGVCFVATPAMTRRMNNTVDILTMSTNSKGLWDKYLGGLKTLMKSFKPGEREESSGLRQTTFLALVDVLVSTDYCLHEGTVSPRDMRWLEENIDQLTSAATDGAAAFKRPGNQNRTNWNHEAAVQRKPTPRLRPSAAKARTEPISPRAGGANASAPPTAAVTRGGATVSSSLGKPRAGRTPRTSEDNSGRTSLTGGTLHGRTPTNLSVFSSLHPGSAKHASTPRGGDFLRKDSASQKTSDATRPSTTTTRAKSAGVAVRKKPPATAVKKPAADNGST